MEANGDCPYDQPDSEIHIESNSYEAHNSTNIFEPQTDSNNNNPKQVNPIINATLSSQGFGKVVIGNKVNMHLTNLSSIILCNSIN